MPNMPYISQTLLSFLVVNLTAVVAVVVLFSLLRFKCEINVLIY